MLANRTVERERLCREAKKLTATGFLSATTKALETIKQKLRVVAMFCKSVNKHFFRSVFCCTKNKHKKHGKKNHVDSGDYAEAFYREVY